MHYRSFLNRDYKSRSVPDSRPSRRHWGLRLSLLAIGLIVLGAVIAKNHESPPQAVTGARDDTQKHDLNARVTLPLNLPEPSAAVPRESPVSASPLAGEQWDEVVVRRGDSLSAIFSRLQMHSQLGAVLELKDATRTLRSIHPGQTIRVRRDVIGDLAELLYEPDDDHRLRIWRSQEGYQSELTEREAEVRQALAAGTISSSLFLAGMDAGMSDNLIMELAGIFGWDIDFALDIRAGDEFSVLYEEYYREGEKLRDGRILAAEFINQGRRYRAALFTDSTGKSGYYSPDGRSMRKTFLRAPVDFRRISSRFQSARFHPVLGKRRPHKGVDYAAATGTPIKAAGDGKVIFKGKKGGYGRTIILQHGNRYSTLYAHMSRYSRKIGVGSRVSQGQTIGYVGQSGLATGPHLHYEFRVNGVHRNPLTVALPTAKPLPKAYMEAFQSQSEALLTQLDTYRRVNVALSGGG